MDATKVNKKAWNTFMWFLGGVLIGLAISKFSARTYYDIGYNRAFAQQSETCSKWWFDHSGRRLAQAKQFMCGGK